MKNSTVTIIWKLPNSATYSEKLPTTYNDDKAKMAFDKNKLKGLVKEPNKFHNYKTTKITCKACDATEYIELFGSFTRNRYARCI